MSLPRRARPILPQVGRAAAMGMGFVDALIDHAPGSLRVALVDRRHGVSGHWLAACRSGSKRLHRAAGFCGVASSPARAGGGLRTTGPEAATVERAGQSTICALLRGAARSHGRARA